MVTISRACPYYRGVPHLIATGLFAGRAVADLEPYTDYEFGEQIYSVTTVKVDANMHEVYLEGLK